MSFHLQRHNKYQTAVVFFLWNPVTLLCLLSPRDSFTSEVASSFPISLWTCIYAYGMLKPQPVFTTVLKTWITPSTCRSTTSVPESNSHIVTLYLRNTKLLQFQLVKFWHDKSQVGQRVLRHYLDEPEFTLNCHKCLHMLKLQDGNGSFSWLYRTIKSMGQKLWETAVSAQGLCFLLGFGWMWGLGVDLMQPIVSTSSAAWVMAFWKQAVFCSGLLGSRVGCHCTASPLWLMGGEGGGTVGGGGGSETCRHHRCLLSAGGKSLWAGWKCKLYACVRQR